jgi:hypothetical protein
MDRMTAFCGLICSECPAYLATKEDDDQRRADTAVQWSRQFKVDLKPEDIDCLGCRSERDPIFAYCRICAIRDCGRKRGLANCAQCADYGCDKLTNFWALAPQAKTNLDAVRAEMQNWI